NTGLNGHIGNPLGYLGRHIVKMRRSSSDYSSKTDHGVILTAHRGFFCNQRYFECSRDLEDIGALLVSPAPLESIERASQEPFSDKIIEAADDDSKPETLGQQFSFENSHRTSPSAEMQLRI